MRDADDRIFEYLDEEERELVESVENDEWIPVEDVDVSKKEARQKAMTTLRRDEGCSPQEGALGSSKGNQVSGLVSISHTGGIDDDALDALVADIKSMFSTSASTHEIMLKSFETTSWIQFLAEAPWWIHALGAYTALYVAEIVKGAAKSTTQALSTRRNRLRVFSSILNDFRQRHPDRTAITIGLPVPDGVFGTVLAIGADSLGEIEHGIALFVHHLPKLMDLIESEDLSCNAFHVQLQLRDDGSMEVTWIDNSKFAEHKRTLRLRDG